MRLSPPFEPPARPSLRSRLADLCRRLPADRAGVSAIAIAIGLSSIAGFAGLGTEVAHWYSNKRAMQGAADAAASTTASALAAGEPSSSFTTTAKSMTAAHQFVDGSGGTTVTVNYPPHAGYYQSSPAIEVIPLSPLRRSA